MWLDADDILLPSDLENLILLKKDLSADVVMMKYNVGFDEYNNPTFSYYRERILKNHFGFSWGGAIHEAISPAGTIIYSDIAITHRKLKPGDQARNLKIFEKMISSGKTLSPREKFYFSRELYYHKRYDEAIRVLNEFLEQGCGFVENEIEACRTLYLCYHALGKENEGLFSLFRSFLYDAPRAEICCDIGNYFQTHDRLLQAIYWYERAMACKPNEKSGGFTLLDCYDFIPLIELCVCYDRLGNQKLSMEYNERAGKIKPQNKAYLYNKQYFEEKLKPSH